MFNLFILVIAFRLSQAIRQHQCQTEQLCHIDTIDCQYDTNDGVLYTLLSLQVL